VALSLRRALSCASGAISKVAAMPKFHLSPLLAMLALLGAAPVLAEVISSGPDRFVLRHEVVVSASPKQVWLALISPASWWSAEHTWSGDSANLTLTPQAGGCFCEKIPEVDEPDRFTLEGSVEHMRVIQAYPERALRMQGALGPLQSEPVTGILTIAISEVAQGTRIVWEYNVGGPMRYELPVIARVMDGVIGQQLKALAQRLEPVAMPSEPAPQPAPEGDGKGHPGTAASKADKATAPDAPVRPSAKPADKASPPKGTAPSVTDAFGALAAEKRP
jgi:uncharacterized protein YndB with AHSA1/START domain